MCGIFACLHSGSGRGECLKAALLRRLKRRGPDYLHEVCIPVAGGDLQLDLLGTLLSMRGDATPQPLCNDAGDWLLWNGNIFGGGIKVEPAENDTVRVLEELGPASSPAEVLHVLSKVHGPWSFVFWQASSCSLWFGRDVFGRRSLLWHLPSLGADKTFALSSVGYYSASDAPASHWREVPALGIFQLKCVTKDIGSAPLLCYPWMQGDSPFQSEEGIAQELQCLETCLSIACVTEHRLQVFFPPLNEARGVVMQHSASQASPVEEKDTPETSPTHSNSTVEGASSVALKQESSDGKTILTLRDHVQGFLDVLQRAVQSRVLRAPCVRRRGAIKNPVFETHVSGIGGSGKGGGGGGGGGGEKRGGGGGGCASDASVCGTARLAILFSGGVDSAVLAALADRCLEPSEEIDLINVAFEQRHVSDQSSGRFYVPDRLSGITCLHELNPNRIWNFVMVNVSLDEVNKMRREHIAHLVYPLCTVLDDSIGCALWFAARGEGLLYSGDQTRSCRYQSSARALLVGIGADEQLAGYSRHRTKFRSAGVGGVIQEVEMDIKRLAKRNLGRDDRCTADHQREAEYPFLDEQVVTYLQQLPMSVKADLSMPRGVGEKRLLREVARLLHCYSAAALPKRAIQFGSRMAKLAGSSNNREHGDDSCDRLLPT